MNYNDSQNQLNQRNNRNIIDSTNPNQQDCYFFLYSQCNRNNCPYRHCQAAKETKEICYLFQNKEICDGSCMKRHSKYHLEKKKDNIMCYFDLNGQCTKPNCEYKHKNQENNNFENKLEKLNIAKKNLEKSNLSENEKQEIIDRILQELRKGGF